MCSCERRRSLHRVLHHVTGRLHKHRALEQTRARDDGHVDVAQTPPITRRGGKRDIHAQICSRGPARSTAA